MSIRMPLYAELSEEQKSILEDVELDGNLFVIGPPGTGKTVIAMWRAKQVCGTNNGIRATLIMYNVVLVSYSGQWEEQHTSVDVKTYHSWAGTMWRRRFGEWPPHIPGGSKWDLDWNQMVSQFVGTNPSIELGHLIVDEGQDFSPEFYAAMGLAMGGAPEDGDSKSTICVVADDNQRMNLRGKKANSKCNQIRAALSSSKSLPEKPLTMNYRNTKEIAALASCFCVGLQPGNAPEVAHPPERSGVMPKIVAKDGLNDMVNTICTYSRNNPGHSVLVILDKALKKCFNKIKHQLGDTDIVVEGYKRHEKDQEKSYLHGTQQLHTGDEGTVTCVHWNSMKGLEADAVFVPEFEEHNMGGDTLDDEMMRMYVMFSRARNHLELQYNRATPLDDRMLTLVRGKAGDTIEWE